MVRDLNDNKMLTYYDFVYWFMLSFCLRQSLGTNSDKTVFKRQTDSYIVSANYGVQSGNIDNKQDLSNRYKRPPTTSTNIPVSKGPSALKGSHYKDDPEIYVTNAYHYSVDNGLSSYKFATTTANTRQLDPTPAPSVEWYSTKHPHERSDLENELLSDIHRPSIEDLHEIISKIVRGATKVHQVVKVPAVYEIHLQEEEVKPNDFKIPLPEWSHSKWKKPEDSRVATRTWNFNLPSKIQYFEQSVRPVYGKYSYPKPFSTNLNHFRSSTSLQNVYGSVSVPMTPGSTAVTFLDHHKQQNFMYRPQAAAPDLSLYYAKKREIENGGSSNKHGYRRNGETQGHRGQTLKQRGSRGMRSYFDGMKYVIQVREKPSK